MIPQLASRQSRELVEHQRPAEHPEHERQYVAVGHQQADEDTQRQDGVVAADDACRFVMVGHFMMVNWFMWMVNWFMMVNWLMMVNGVMMVNWFMGMVRGFMMIRRFMMVR